MFFVDLFTFEIEEYTLLISNDKVTLKNYKYFSKTVFFINKYYLYYMKCLDRNQ